MNPDASTIAAGAPIESDLARSQKARPSKYSGAGKPIYVTHRTKKEIVTPAT